MPLSAEAKAALSRAFGWAIINKGIAFNDLQEAYYGANTASALRRVRNARGDLEALLDRVKAAEDLLAKDLRMDEENPTAAFFEALSFSTAPKPALRVVGK